jgi:hypothetical protein
MLKVGLPKEMVINKMKQDGCYSDIAILDLNPDQSLPPNFVSSSKSAAKPPPPPLNPTSRPHAPLPPRPPPAGPRPPPLPLSSLPKGSPADGPMVPVSEHPLYGKFFKMLKVGLPHNFIEKKMIDEGADPAFIHYEPTRLIPLAVAPKPAGGVGGPPRPAFAAAAAAAAAAKKDTGPKIRKKKLFLKAIDQKQIGEDSLWAEKDDDDLTLDTEEFNRLFVEDATATQPKALLPDKEDKIKKIKGVTLINVKRAQNAAIALARIKFSYQEMKTKIKELDSTAFTIEQLESMKEFLPNQEEINQIKGYKGDINLLGLAEKYMFTMMDMINEAKILINCIVYKLQFASRWQDCKHKLSMLESACDHIKLSVKLKKVLKTILKIVNQLSEGEELKGITVESLLKLSTAKAFDKKTSVLQYVIMLITRHYADALQFPDDLKYLFDVSRLSLDTIISEKNLLENELKIHIEALKKVLQTRSINPTSTIEKSEGTDSSLTVTSSDGESAIIANRNMLETLDSFESRLRPLCMELNQRTTTLNQKYQNILNYFGEDSKLSCQEFFQTLSRFVTDFISTRDQYERMRQAELKKQQRAQAAAQAAAAKAAANALNGGNGSVASGGKPGIKVRRSSKLSRMVENNRNNNVFNPSVNPYGGETTADEATVTRTPVTGLTETASADSTEHHDSATELNASATTNMPML